MLSEVDYPCVDKVMRSNPTLVQRKFVLFFSMSSFFLQNCKKKKYLKRYVFQTPVHFSAIFFHTSDFLCRFCSKRSKNFSRIFFSIIFIVQSVLDMSFFKSIFIFCKLGLKMDSWLNSKAKSLIKPWFLVAG